MAGGGGWWHEWDGIPARLRPVTVGRVVGALVAAGLLTGVILDGLSFVLLLLVTAFNVGGGVLAWRMARRLEEEGER